MNNPREHAHELINRLPEAQISALVGLLEAIIDPVTAALSNAPVDDEPLTAKEGNRSPAPTPGWNRDALDWDLCDGCVHARPSFMHHL